MSAKSREWLIPVVGTGAIVLAIAIIAMISPRKSYKTLKGTVFSSSVISSPLSVFGNQWMWQTTETVLIDFEDGVRRTYQTGGVGPTTTGPFYKNGDGVVGVIDLETDLCVSLRKEQQSAVVSNVISRHPLLRRLVVNTS